MADIDYSIKNIEKSVKLDGDIKNVDVSRLTEPGENFISLVLKVDFTVEKDGKSEIVSTVAKRIPMGERKSIDFNVNAMKNEIIFYTEIVQLIKDFAKELGIEELDFFPEYVTSRYSCDPEKNEKKEADADSYLFLENLIPLGYKNEDRYKGFDLVTTKAILKRLALLHSVPIAMKIKKPDSFKVIKEFFDGMVKPKPEDAEKFEPPPGTKSPDDLLLDIMINMSQSSPYVDKLKTRQGKKLDLTLWFKPGEEPWNTFVHGDFWVNNIMINPRKGKEPLVKFVDFQMPQYGSYAKDLVFLLLCSISNDVIEKYMDDLLWYYYEEFTSILKKAELDLELTFTAFLKELRRVAIETEFHHVLFFTTVVFGEKKAILDPALQEFDPIEHMTKKIKNMNGHHKDKLGLIATEAGQRNWI